MFRYKSKYKKVGVLPIRIVKSNVSSLGPPSRGEMFLFDEGPTLKTLDLYRQYSDLFYISIGRYVDGFNF